MKNPVSIGTLIIHIASDPKDDLGKVLRQLPFVQEQLLAQGKMSLEDLSDEQLDRLIGTVFALTLVTALLLADTATLAPLRARALPAGMTLSELLLNSSRKESEQRPFYAG